MPAAVARAKSAKTKLMNGKVVSSRSKTGSSECSAAMSEWVTTRKSGSTPASVFAILGQCRAKARALKQASQHKAAGNEAKAQRLEAIAAGKKGPVTAKDRMALAKEKRATLNAKRAANPIMAAMQGGATLKPNIKPKSDLDRHNQASRVSERIGHHRQKLASRLSQPDNKSFTDHQGVFARNNQLSATKSRVDAVMMDSLNRHIANAKMQGGGASAGGASAPVKAEGRGTAERLAKAKQIRTMRSRLQPGERLVVTDKGFGFKRSTLLPHGTQPYSSADHSPPPQTRPASRPLGAYGQTLKPMSLGKASEAMSKQVRHNGEFMSRKAMIDKAVKSGAAVQQSKTGRRLTSPSGAFLDEGATTKTGMNYAEMAASRFAKAQQLRADRAAKRASAQPAEPRFAAMAYNNNTDVIRDNDHNFYATVRTVKGKLGTSYEVKGYSKFEGKHPDIEKNVKTTGQGRVTLGRYSTKEEAHAAAMKIAELESPRPAQPAASPRADRYNRLEAQVFQGKKDIVPYVGLNQGRGERFGDPQVAKQVEARRNAVARAKRMIRSDRAQNATPAPTNAIQPAQGQGAFIFTPPTPSLRAQADAYRASKGTAADRAKALGAKITTKAASLNAEMEQAKKRFDRYSGNNVDKIRSLRDQFQTVIPAKAQPVQRAATKLRKIEEKVAPERFGYVRNSPERLALAKSIKQTRAAVPALKSKAASDYETFRTMSGNLTRRKDNGSVRNALRSSESATKLNSTQSSLKQARERAKRLTRMTNAARS